MQMVDQRLDLLLSMGCAETTYAKHKETCKNGCLMCNLIRGCEENLISELHEIQENPGELTTGQIQNYRRQFNQIMYIRDLYEDDGAIYDENGDFRIDVYMVCVINGFKDSQITDYFKIPPKIWVPFKRENFPDWKELKEQYIYDYSWCVKEWKIEKYKKSNFTAQIPHGETRAI